MEATWVSETVRRPERRSCASEGSTRSSSSLNSLFTLNLLLGAV